MRLLGIPVMRAQIQLRRQLVGEAGGNHVALLDVVRRGVQHRTQQAGGVGRAQDAALVELVGRPGQVHVQRAVGVRTARGPALGLEAELVRDLQEGAAHREGALGITQQATIGLVRAGTFTGGDLHLGADRAGLDQVLDHVVLASTHRQADLGLVSLDVGRVLERRVGRGVDVEQDVVLTAQRDAAEVARLDADPRLAPEVGRGDGAGVGVQPVLQVGDGLQAATQIFVHVDAEATLGHAARDDLLLGRSGVGVAGVAQPHVHDAVELHARLGPCGTRAGCEDAQRQCGFLHVMSPLFGLVAVTDSQRTPRRETVHVAHRPREQTLSSS